MNYLEFDDISYEQLQTWAATGKPGNIPENLVLYLQSLELVRSMYDKYKSKKFILNVLSQAPWELSEYKAQKLFNDSINFFYANNDIKREAWAHVYADKLDKLALLAIEMDDIATATKCHLEAAKLRMGDKEIQNIPKGLRDRRVIIYTMRPKDVGLPEANKKKLNEWIDILPDIPSEDRLRLKRDGLTPGAKGNPFETDISDIPFIEADSNE